MKYMKLFLFIVVFNKYSFLIKFKDLLISDVIDKIICFFSKYEYFIVVEYVVVEKVLVLFSSCSYRWEVIKDN